MSQQDWGSPGAPPVHPVLACVASLTAALDEVVEVDAGFMTTGEKRQALVELAAVQARVAERGLRVQAESADVAVADGARDLGAWLDHHVRIDRAAARAQERVAEAISRRWHRVRAGMRTGVVSLSQAAVITAALDRLPDHLEPEVAARAEERLVAEAAVFGPAQLRVLGRRVLDVVAPELGEEAERKALEAEEAAAAERTWLVGRRRGDGRTRITGEVPDTTWDRLETYLEAYLSPRQPDQHDQPDQAAGVGNPDDRRPYQMRLGSALVAFLEHLDPQRLPIHGGDATTVMVTIDLATLAEQTQAAGVAHIGDVPVSAAAVRRLACTAGIIPAVLGGQGQVLDLGRTRGCSPRPNAKRCG